jgi:streptogramin lyase
MAKYTASTEKRFKSPGPQPNGLQAAADGLWVIDQVNLKVHKLDWDSGQVLHEFDTETEHSSGITLGDDAVWITSTYQLEVVKIDPKDGTTLARYPDPGVGLTSGRELTGDTKESGSHGIEWRDGKVYVAGPPTQRVHIMDAATWEEVAQFPTGGLRVHGIGWADNGMLWVSDTSSGTVMLLDPEKDGRVYDVFRVDEPDEVHGMTVRENGEIWYCDAGTKEIGVLRR